MLSKKEEEHDQLKESHEEMRKNIAELKKNAEVNPAEIYEQEFNRIKEMFEEEKVELNHEITSLRNQLFSRTNDY